MITALIIDDEENNRIVIRTVLQKYCPEIRVLGEAEGVEQAFILINQFKPKLVLLDINMKPKDGFDLLKMFSKISFEVIFITAHDNFAMKAFKFNAVDYVMKPIESSKLKLAIDKAKERIVSKQGSNLVMHFIKTLSDKNELVNKFSVHHHGKVVFVTVSEISFIQTFDDRTVLNLFDNSHFYSSKDLIKFEEILCVSDNFIRINKSVIINANYIKSYSKGEICFVEMKSGQSFEVSRRRKTDIIKKLKAV